MQVQIFLVIPPNERLLILKAIAIKFTLLHSNNLSFLILVSYKYRLAVNFGPTAILKFNNPAVQLELISLHNLPHISNLTDTWSAVQN